MMRTGSFVPRRAFALCSLCSLAVACHGGDAQARPDRDAVVAQRTLSLGEDEDSAIVFAKVNDIAIAADGTIYVGDSGDQNIKVFDANGRFVRRIGRKGKGPGEFTTVDRLSISGDTLLVEDMNGHRFTTFNPDGSVIATHPRDRGDGHSTFLTRRSSVGWVGDIRNIAKGDGRANVWAAPLTKLFAIDPYSLNVVRQLYDLPHPDTSRSRDVFHASRPGTIGQDYVYFGVQARPYEIHVHDISSGKFVRKFTQDFKPRRVREEWLKEAHVRLEEIFKERPDAFGGEQPMFAQLDALSLGETMSPIWSMREGADGNLWVQRLDLLTDPADYILGYTGSLFAKGGGASTWDVFDPTGRRLKQVVFPASFRMFYANGLSAYGIVTDELGVQSVAKYDAGTQ